MIVEVVAAVFFRQKGESLELALFQRKAGDRGAGLWEFPGGKVEGGESREQALKREIDEELKIDIEVLSSLGRSSLIIGHRTLNLEAFWVRSKNFNWTLHDHDQFRWVGPQHWRGMNIAPLDVDLIVQAFNEGPPQD